MGGAYETLRMPVKLIFMLFTDIESALLRMSFPATSALWDSVASP